MRINQSINQSINPSIKIQSINATEEGPMA
jgi:hypothetical protein